jgi:glycosyltransferase involved in cell wall biosynthesis
MEAPNVPAISVIVPAYGVANLVGEALVSLQQQTFTDWEAIVIDDGAPDELIVAVGEFSADPRIRLLHTPHGGVSVARNHGIAAARAPLIALLDGDDTYEPDYLATMKAAIEAAPGIGFVSCDATFFGNSPLAGRAFSDQIAQVPPVTLDRVLRRAFNVFTAGIMLRGGFRPVGPPARRRMGGTLRAAGARPVPAAGGFAFQRLGGDVADGRTGLCQGGGRARRPSRGGDGGEDAPTDRA